MEVKLLAKNNPDYFYTYTLGTRLLTIYRRIKVGLLENKDTFQCVSTNLDTYNNRILIDGCKSQYYENKDSLDLLIKDRLEELFVKYSIKEDN